MIITNKEMAEQVAELTQWGDVTEAEAESVVISVAEQSCPHSHRTIKAKMRCQDREMIVYVP